MDNKTHFSDGETLVSVALHLELGYPVTSAAFRRSDADRGRFSSETILSVACFHLVGDMAEGLPWIGESSPRWRLSSYFSCDLLGRGLRLAVSRRASSLVHLDWPDIILLALLVAELIAVPILLLFPP
jgi:hypothetical protein